MLWFNAAFVAAWLMLNGISTKFITEAALTINNPDPYPIQKFDIRSTNQSQAYLELIRGNRAMLTDDQLDLVFGVPRLADRDSVPSSRRFVLLELTNLGGVTITVVLETSRLYLVGYRRRNEFLYFPDTAEGVNALFPDLQHNALPFDSSYGALEREAGDRSRIRLGIAPFNQAIFDLEDYRRNSLARSFVVIIQMIPEAIRFRYIEHFVGNIITTQVPDVPSSTMLDLEITWGTICTRMQHSVDGTLDPPIPLTNREGLRNLLSTVTGRLTLNMGILFFVCNRPRIANHLSLISTTPSHTDGGGTNCTNISQPTIRLPIAAGDICKNIGEPTVRIVGRNGLCADVRGGFYNNGDPIILWPCKSNEDVNQLWTLKADGTIRSNGKCLTTYGFNPGNYIMIYACSSVTDATKWDISDKGTIINPRSSLVITSWSGKQDTELALQKNVYPTNQGWVVANNTQPIVTPIMNDGNMCFVALDDVHTIYYSDCQSDDKRQSFAIYPDGSIRPDERRDDCLTADTNILSVFTSGCNGGSEQRWSFNRDYTIINLHASLAMDMNAHYMVVSLSPVQVKPLETQEWHAWFL